jgi:ABC-type nitrate/sulfonate/bicarbonate transport system ATPase subunit
MNVEIANLAFQRSDSRSRAHVVLRGVDLVIRSGTVHAIVGPNGCGKTTLLRLIAGLEKPSHGSIEITGEQRHPNTTAFIFQDPALLPWWNVERNISISAEMDGVVPPAIDRIREYTANRVGLGRFRKFAPHQLSRGMQTKANMGRAFAHDADVLLLDEPFVHLDQMSKRAMHEELETHWQLDPRTHVLVTHDIDEAVLLADRVSVMSPSPGRIVDTITVDVKRPRGVGSVTDPGFRAAVARLWELLDGGGW